MFNETIDTRFNNIRNVVERLENNMYTAHYTDVTESMLVYLIQKFVMEECSGEGMYAKICNELKDEKLNKQNSSIYTKVLIINALINNVKALSLREYHYIWSHVNYKTFFELNLYDISEKVTFKYIKKCPEKSIKYKSDILTYVILKDMIDQLVCEINNKLMISGQPPKEFNRNEMPQLAVPQYLIEEEKDQIIIFRATH